MKKHCLFILGAMAAAGVPLTGCQKPEIAKVLDDYCDYKVNDCQCEGSGTAQYCTESNKYDACESFHKDLLNSTADGNASACKGEVEEFFIALMESQMAGTCSKSFITSLMEQEMLSQMHTTLLCLDDNKVDTKQTVDAMMSAIVGPSAKGFGELAESFILLENVCRKQIYDCKCESKPAYCTASQDKDAQLKACRNYHFDMLSKAANAGGGKDISACIGDIAGLLNILFETQMAACSNTLTSGVKDPAFIVAMPAAASCLEKAGVSVTDLIAAIAGGSGS